MKSQFVVLFLATALGVAAAPIGFMVPAYFYPVGNRYWDSMSNAATRVPLIAILNPDSGPGAAQDANYISAVANLHHAGGQVFGYVYTSQAMRAMSPVTNDFNFYLSFYALDGFFIDEMADDTDTNHLLGLQQFNPAFRPAGLGLLLLVAAVAWPVRLLGELLPVTPDVSDALQAAAPLTAAARRSIRFQAGACRAMALVADAFALTPDSRIFEFQVLPTDCKGHPIFPLLPPASA